MKTQIQIEEGQVPQKNQRGAGWVVHYGWYPTPFGAALLLMCGDAVLGLGFCDTGQQPECLSDMMKRWPSATYLESQEKTASFGARLPDLISGTDTAPIPLFWMGTPFDHLVWRALLAIPRGATSSYSALAQGLGKPTATRAVGGAIGRNPIAFIIPCHRVMGRSGAITGYHWGLDRKKKMLDFESTSIKSSDAP